MTTNPIRTPPFRHLILTRFNVKFPWLVRPLGDEWLRHRCDLFERFTLPCMRRQTNRNFTWLIFVDSETSLPFRTRIFEYCKGGICQPVLVKGGFDGTTVRASVAQFVAGTEFLITTRLDNDDCLCRTFVEVIQRHFARQTLEFLNFTNGYVLQGNHLYSAQHPSNSFMSLIEKAPSVRTVLCGDHTKLSQFGSVRQIPKPPGWLVVVHDRNVINRVRGRPCNLSELHRHFDLKIAM